MRTLFFFFLLLSNVAGIHATSLNFFSVKCSKNLDSNTIQPGIWLLFVSNASEFQRAQLYILSKMQKSDPAFSYKIDMLPKPPKSWQKKKAFILFRKPSDQYIDAKESTKNLTFIEYGRKINRSWSIYIHYVNIDRKFEHIYWKLGVSGVGLGAVRLDLRNLMLRFEK